MPIEFRCTGCKKLLRTKDDSAGKQARCPECGTLLNVPGTRAAVSEPTVAPAATGPPAMTPAAGAQSFATQPYSARQDAVDNPYTSPRTGHLDNLPPPVPSGELRPTPLDIGETLTLTGRILWRNFGRCLLATLIFAIVATVPRLPILRYSYAAMQRDDWAAYLGWFACDNVLGFLLYAYVGAGLRLFMLKIARGQDAPISTLFGGRKYYIPLLIGQIFLAMSIFLGFFALFVGAIIAALFFWAYGYLIVDRNLGAVDAFSTSARITAGNRFAVLATYLIVVFLGNILSVLTCGIGFLFVIPYVILLPAVMYLSMTGQPIAETLEG